MIVECRPRKKYEKNSNLKQAWPRINLGKFPTGLKVFTESASDFSAEIGNSNVSFAQNQVVSETKQKKKKKGLHRN